MSRGRILLFAKAPVPGAVKTRLIPALGATGAAALQTNLIRHTLATATESGAEVILWCHPDTEHPLFTACADTFGVSLRIQHGADLGERMYNAFAAADGPALVIGTDCPDLTPTDLTQTLALLDHGTDAVLGPALDGGYYLLGLNRADPSLFQGIAWGGEEVAGQTRQRLRALGWSWREIAGRRDIDRPDDLVYLPPSLALP